MPSLRSVGCWALLGWLAACNAPAGEVIRVRADAWMPFNGGEGSTPGYVVEILQTIFDGHGIGIEYANMSWEESLEACRAGTVDAVPCANQKEGKGLVFPQETVADIKYSIFTLKTSAWKLSGEASLRSQRIGAADGYSYWEMLDRFIEANPKNVVKLEGDDIPAVGIQKLRSGEIDLLPECPQVFFWTLKSHKLDGGLFRTACLMPGDPVYVVFRPDEKGKQWARLFDAGIRELRASGALAKILTKYGLEDWK